MARPPTTPPKGPARREPAKMPALKIVFSMSEWDFFRAVPVVSLIKSEATTEPIKPSKLLIGDSLLVSEDFLPWKIPTVSWMVS